MQQSTNHFWCETDSSIYPTLKKLYEDECVRCVEEQSESNKPRKVYTITKRGQQELERWLTKDPETSKSRNDFLLKIFFGWNVPTDVCLRHIRAVQVKCEQGAHYYEELYKQKQQREKTKANVYQMLTLRSAILLNTATLEWCEEAITVLTDWKKKNEPKK